MTFVSFCNLIISRFVLRQRIRQHRLGIKITRVTRDQHQRCGLVEFAQLARQGIAREAAADDDNIIDHKYLIILNNFNVRYLM